MPSRPFDGVTRYACLSAVFETSLAVEQLPSSFNFGRSRSFRILLVGWLYIGTPNCQVVKNVADLFFGKISPVRHALLFKFREQPGGRRIA